MLAALPVLVVIGVFLVVRRRRRKRVVSTSDGLRELLELPMRPDPWRPRAYRGEWWL